MVLCISPLDVHHDSLGGTSYFVEFIKTKPLNKITGLSRKANSKSCVFKIFSFERNQKAFES